MAYWFIRLGAKRDIEDKELYQALAKKHSLIKIGYDIQEKITDRGREGIKKYFQDRHKYKNQKLTKIVSLVNSFINIIEEGDIIISPFDNGYIRIGEVISECDTLETFLKGSELESFLYKYPGSQDKQEIKPTRRVKWLTDEISRDEFPVQLQEALGKSMPAAVTNLKIENIINLSDSSDPKEIAMVKLAELQKAKAEYEAKIKKAEEDADKRRWNDIAKIIYIASGATFGSTILTALITAVINSCVVSCWFDFSWLEIPFPFMVEILIILLSSIVVYLMELTEASIHTDKEED